MELVRAYKIIQESWTKMESKAYPDKPNKSLTQKLIPESTWGRNSNQLGYGIERSIPTSVSVK